MQGEQIGSAIVQIHPEPDQDWTLAVSRSVFAARFR